MDSIASVIGGLGLFFVGVWFLTENLKSLAGRRFRRSVVRLTKNSMPGYGLGAVLGAVAQSMAVTIFVLVSLLSAGLITVRSAMPILVGANFGTSILVFLTTLDLHIAVLCLVGISGILLVSDRFSKFQHQVGAVFGFSLLFIGIGMLRSGALLIVEQPWAAELLQNFQDSYLLTFVLGALITLVAQSAAATSILAITMAGVGVFGVEQTIMAIYGANLGSGLVSLVLSSGLRGKARQLAMYQILFLNILAALVFAGLFYVELFSGVPLIGSLVGSISDDIETQMAWLYLCLNLPGLVLLPFSADLEQFLQKRFPESEADNDAKPQYVHDQAINDPSTALDLIELEHLRLVGFYTRYFSIVRQERENSKDAQIPLNTLHKSFDSVLKQIAELQEELGSTSSASSMYERLNLSMNKHRSIQMIESTVFDIVTCVNQITQDSHLQELADSIIESLDTVLLTLNDALSDGNEFDHQLLNQMTGDRSGVLKGIRNNYLANSEKLQGEDQAQLLKLTNLCERFFWLLGDLRLLDHDRNLANSSSRFDQRNTVAVD